MPRDAQISPAVHQQAVEQILFADAQPSGGFGSRHADVFREGPMRAISALMLVAGAEKQTIGLYRHTFT
jgi:hypothetical protein